MNFIFYITVQSPEQLHREIVDVIEEWFPKKDWIQSIANIQQVPQAEDKTKKGKKRKLELTFEVTAEIYSRTLKNLVFKIGRTN